MRTGTIAIAGRPNVGKSTLLNRLVGAKLSITSRKAQTTRHRILGVRTDETAQYVFLDTPGFQNRHRNLLNRAMNRAVTDALASADVALVVVDGNGLRTEDEAVIALLPQGHPAVLAINKADQAKNQADLLKVAERTPPNWRILPPSCRCRRRPARTKNCCWRRLGRAPARRRADV